MYSLPLATLSVEPLAWQAPARSGGKPAAVACTDGSMHMSGYSCGASRSVLFQIARSNPALNAAKVPCAGLTSARW
jgi:hypothetical protein